MNATQVGVFKEKICFLVVCTSAITAHLNQSTLGNSSSKENPNSVMLLGICN